MLLCKLKIEISEKTTEKMPRQKKSFLRENLLTILTVIGVVGGTAIGCLIRATSSGQWTKREVMYLAFPGELFLRMLKTLIIPLLMSSVISAIGGLDLSLSKKIAFRSILYYATTTVCAVILGILLVVTIRPGVGAAAWNANGGGQGKQVLSRHVLTQDTLLDLIR